MSLSAHCHLQIVTGAPGATNPIFPAGYEAQYESVSGPQSPGLAGGYQQRVLGVSPFAVSLASLVLPALC